MMVVCKDRLDRIRVDERMGVEAAAAVEDDINALLAGKSYDHLVALQNQVSAKLASGEPVDVDYWENLLKKLLVWKSKVRSSDVCSMDVLTIMQAKLKAFHEVVVRNRLEQLRKRQRDEALQAQEELLAGVAQSAQQGAHRPKVGTALPLLAPDEVEVYTRSMSPPLVDNSTLTGEEREMVLSAEDDLRERVRLDTLVSTSWLDRTQLLQRRAVAASRYVAKAQQPVDEAADIEAAAPPSAAQLAAENTAAEAMYRAEMERDEDEEEEAFNTEAPLATSAYTWGDKYRPRKPRYFNRVHTGYEWNKYNQTHYDTDNPPPKVVQGYKVCQAVLTKDARLIRVRSSTSSILISSTNQKHQRTRLSRIRMMKRRSSSTSQQVRRMRTLHSASSTVNGSTRTSGWSCPPSLVTFAHAPSSVDSVVALIVGACLYGSISGETCVSHGSCVVCPIHVLTVLPEVMDRKSTLHLSIMYTATEYHIMATSLRYRTSSHQQFLEVDDQERNLTR
jgi:hypothetical protein